MSAATAEWFQVDRAGLAKLMERRGPEFVLYELVSNALDQTVTRIDVTLTPVEGKRLVSLVVEDDDPDGFQDLQHSFVLFAESAKKSNADKRGRFNLGEKLVLALCAEASISSTTGTVRFDAEGRHRGRTVRSRGSRFEGLLRITRADMQTMIECAERILVPPGVTLVVNGREIAGRSPVAVFETTLDTELADAEGVLRRRARKTVVKVYEPLPGEEATLYEMGIPVVTSTFDRYHVSVEQKIPLTFERDNVTPAYLRTLRTAVLNATHASLTPLGATAGWVRDALASPDVTPEAVQSAVTARFGAKIVSYDPSDPEANIFSETPIDRPALAQLSLTERELLKACGPDARVWQSRVVIRRGGKTAWLCPADAARPRRVKLTVLAALVERGLLTLDENGETDLVWRKT